MMRLYRWFSLLCWEIRTVPSCHCSGGDSYSTGEPIQPREMPSADMWQQVCSADVNDAPTCRCSLPYLISPLSLHPSGGNDCGFHFCTGLHTRPNRHTTLPVHSPTLTHWSNTGNYFNSTTWCVIRSTRHTFSNRGMIPFVYATAQ